MADKPTPNSKPRGAHAEDGKPNQGPKKDAAVGGNKTKTSKPTSAKNKGGPKKGQKPHGHKPHRGSNPEKQEDKFPDDDPKFVQLREDNQMSSMMKVTKSKTVHVEDQGPKKDAAAGGTKAKTSKPTSAKK